VALSNSDTLIKVGASIAGGILIALQGMNLQTTNNVKSETERVGTEQGHELRVQSEELRGIRELLERFKGAQEKQADMIETLKRLEEAAHPTPAPK
jgi:CHAD domain-containing protein